MTAKPSNPTSSMSALLENVMHHSSRMRHQSRLWVGLVLILLSALLLYSTSDTINQRLLNDKFTSMKDLVSFGRKPAQSEWTKPRPGHLIPPKIWQIMLPKSDAKGTHETAVDPDNLKETATWLAMNEDHTYTLVGEKGGRDFISRHFNDTVLSTYDSLPNVGMKSDFLRYLILDVEGGVYADTDTVALRPVDEWVPEQFRNQTRLIVGIEFDQLDGPAWVDIPHSVSFCQWTIAAAPGHPVFKKMQDRVLRSAQDLVRVHGTTWKPTSFEVMNSTGPAAWTDVVWEYLQETDETLTDLRNVSALGSPRLFRDALILPIDGFGMGQRHSGSTNDGTIPEQALIKHLFGGTWRGD